MKSEIQNTEPTKPEIKYPCLMQAIPSKLVIMFSDVQTGMVMNKGLSCWKVGHYATNWVNATDIDSWKPLPPDTKVILSNS